MTTQTDNRQTDRTGQADESKALALRAQSQALRKFNPERIRIEAQALRALMPAQYGKPQGDKYYVTDEQLTSLIIASISSGLSPARGEIFYIPGVGVQVASKITAADAVAEQGRLGNTLTVRFERVTPEMCEIDGSVYTRWSGAVKPGDVARACRIVSSKARMDYYRIRAEIAKEGAMYGFRGHELERWVTERAGYPPETIALGIVRAKENFGGDEKYTREQRAEKRALKAALTMGGYWAMDRRNYGGVQLADERDAADEILEGDYTISTPEHVEPVGGVSGTSEPTEEPLAPVSEDNRLKLSQLIDLYPQAKAEDKREGKTQEEKERFRDSILKMVELVNAQLEARKMAAIEAKSTGQALPLIARALEIMRDYDERAPHMEPAPATSEGETK